MENEIFSANTTEKLSYEEVTALSGLSDKLSEFYENNHDILPDNIPVQGFQDKDLRVELTAILNDLKNSNQQKHNDKCISDIDSLLNKIADIDKHFSSKENEKPSVLKQLSQIKAQPKAEKDTVQKHSSRNEVSI